MLHILVERFSTSTVNTHYLGHSNNQITSNFAVQRGRAMLCDRQYS